MKYYLDMQDAEINILKLLSPICYVNFFACALVGEWNREYVKLNLIKKKQETIKWIKTGFTMKSLKYLTWLKNSFLFTCDPFNNIQQALVFSVLNMQANQYKNFECRINFLFPQTISKRHELKLLWSNLMGLKKQMFNWKNN